MACLSPSLNRLVFLTFLLVLEGFWALFCQLFRLGGKLRLFFMSRDRDLGINSVKDLPSFCFKCHCSQECF